MAQTVVGIFNDPGEAQSAVARLTAYGFTDADIDITNQDSWTQRSHDDSMEDSDEGFGAKISRFFRNLFDDEREVERYSNLARAGTVVSVYAVSRGEAERASEILDEFGAINVDEHHSAGKESAGGMTTLADGADNDRSNINRSIPVIEEDIQVGKRAVETGGIRLRSRIIERPVEENLRLRTEHVSIDRTPANRPATDADLHAFREGEIEVRERTEVPVVDKKARVVEEINVGKDVEEREEVVRDTVRKTDVEVEKIDQSKDTGTAGHSPGAKNRL